MQIYAKICMCHRSKKKQESPQCIQHENASSAVCTGTHTWARTHTHTSAPEAQAARRTGPGLGRATDPCSTMGCSRLMYGNGPGTGARAPSVEEHSACAGAGTNTPTGGAKTPTLCLIWNFCMCTGPQKSRKQNIQNEKAGQFFWRVCAC